PSLQRTQRLPFQPVERIAGGVALRDRRSGKALVPIVVVAIGAGEIELALPLAVEGAALGDEGFELRVGTGLDPAAARLPGDKGGERQEVAALEGERRRLLVVGTAQVDALLEIDGTSQRLVEGRITCGDALHAGGGVAMTIGASLLRRAGL